MLPRSARHFPLSFPSALVFTVEAKPLEALSDVFTFLHPEGRVMTVGKSLLPAGKKPQVLSNFLEKS
jgi:hypothetical protein